MRTVPNPHTLNDAVREVVRQNQSIGYIPTRFVQAITVNSQEELVAACDKLVHSDSAFEAIWVAVTNDYPGLLTLEDLIVHSLHGQSWGLDESTITEAKYRVESLDNSAGQQRWTPSKA